MCPDDGETAQALLHKADVELYEMKDAYRGLLASTMPSRQ